MVAISFWLQCQVWLLGLFSDVISTTDLTQFRIGHDKVIMNGELEMMSKCSSGLLECNHNTRICHWSLSWADCTKCTSPHFTPLRTILIWFSYRYLSLVSCFPTKCVYAHLTYFLSRHASSIYLTILQAYFVILIITLVIGTNYEVSFYAVFSFYKSPVDLHWIWVKVN
jgi:hypothetical protein